MTPSDRRARVQDRFDAQGLGDVGEWLAGQRRDGLSWVDISFNLRALIDLPVSYETLRRWGLNDAEARGEELP
jgi:hypothetical protein